MGQGPVDRNCNTCSSLSLGTFIVSNIIFCRLFQQFILSKDSLFDDIELYLGEKQVDYRRHMNHDRVRAIQHLSEKGQNIILVNIVYSIFSGCC